MFNMKEKTNTFSVLHSIFDSSISVFILSYISSLLLTLFFLIHLTHVIKICLARECKLFTFLQILLFAPTVLQQYAQKKHTVKPALETTCIKRPPALRDHSFDITLLKST